MIDQEQIHCMAVRDPKAIRLYKEYIERNGFDPVAYRIQNGKLSYLLCLPKEEIEEFTKLLEDGQIETHKFGFFNRSDLITKLQPNCIEELINGCEDEVLVEKVSDTQHLNNLIEKEESND